MNGNNEMAVRSDSGALLPKGNASTMVAQSREMAEAISSMQMAKMFPRDIVAVRDRILNACTRPTLAETACYTYARGGQEVTGPSIRLAEAIAQQYGNMQAGVRELEQRNGESTCEAYAWDMETNTRVSKVFQVSHVRHTKRGDTLLTDPRDIYELVANNGARRLRACILAVVPGDLVEEAVRQCDVTLATKFEVTPDRIKNLLAKFAEYGVTKEQIEVRIQRHIDAMTPAQLADLGKKYNSIKDGMSKAEDWFPKEAANGGATGDGGNGASGGDRPATAKDVLRLALAKKREAEEAAVEPPRAEVREGQMEVSDII